jgi:hypothetical protein
MKRNRSGIKSNTLKTFLVTLISVSLLLSVNQVSAHAQSTKAGANTREFTRWDYYSYKYVGEKLNRLILPGENLNNCKPCKWTNADGRKSRSFHPVRVKAFEEIKKFGRQP